MSALITSPADCKVRSVIKFLNAKGETPPAIHRELIAVYGPNVMSIEMVRRWVRHFKEGRTEVHDLDRGGRPSDATSENSITAVRAIVEADRRVTFPGILRELRETHFIEISQGTLHHILHDELGLSKLSARWVPKELTDEHRTNRMGAALHFLSLFNEFGPSLFERIVTGDECWVHFYTPETKNQSMEWLPKGSKPPKKFKSVPTVGKVFVTVFWDTEGVLLVEFLPKSTRKEKIRVNKERYVDTLMKLHRAIQDKRRGKLSKKILFIHDNARPHTAEMTQAMLETLKWEVFPHPPHSPDLAPSDFHLFPAMHVAFGGKRFNSDEEVQQAVLSYLRKLAAEFYFAGIEKLVYRYNKCLDLAGDYVEK